MKIYNYNADSGQFVGESIADADPLSHGEWLVPAHATTIEPPQTTDELTVVIVGAGVKSNLKSSKPM